MTCRNLESRPEILEDFASGALAAEDAERVRSHVDGCNECAAAVEAARESGALFREAFIPAVEPTGAFWTRMRAALREEEARLAQGGDFQSTLEWLAWRFSFGAGVLAVLLLGIVIGTHLPQQKTDAISADSHELVPEPARQPATGDDVLLELASGKGRIGR